MSATELKVSGNRNWFGIDLNVTVIVLYLSASIDATDRAKDHPSTFGSPPTAPLKEVSSGMRSRNWRNRHGSTPLGMLEILKASAVSWVVFRGTGVVARFRCPVSWSDICLRLDIV